MFLDYKPGDFVVNPKNKDWGTGQIQSIIKDKVTVNFENIGNVSVNTNGNNMQASTALSTIVNDPDWGTWPNSFQGYIMLGVTVEAGLDGLDISIDIKDQTSPGLALLTTQNQNGNIDCELSNFTYDGSIVLEPTAYLSTKIKSEVSFKSCRKAFLMFLTHVDLTYSLLGFAFQSPRATCTDVS